MSQHLLCQLLDKDQAADEDVGVSDVLLELLIVLVVAQLLQQVSHHLDAHLQEQNTIAQVAL